MRLKKVKKNDKDLPIVLMTIGRIESACIKRRATLGHVSVAQIRQGSAANVHATATQHLAVTQITGSDVYVSVVVVTTDMMMRRRVQNGVLSGRRATRKGLQASGPGCVTTKKRLHGFYCHLSLVVCQGTAAC